MSFLLLLIYRYISHQSKVPFTTLNYFIVNYLIKYSLKAEYNREEGKIIELLFFKLVKIIASLALSFTSLNMNLACMLFIHQPKLPDNAKKLRRF
ncbi:cyclic lactone autoinducer peptide [Lacrimispora amygdalina]|uniref:cyclic lactone autoinducer peptide n=1 Tax=Lacrimispora TaxID=2719231 RepID=UPI00242002FE